MSQPRKKESKAQTLVFVFALCLGCGLILSLLATALRAPQQEAVEVNQITELLTAAHLIDPQKPPSKSELFALYNRRIQPLFTTEDGLISTPESIQIDLATYIAKNQKKGYANLKEKLFYRIASSDGKKLEGIVIPINGFGLWDAIYGYLAIAADGVHVIGTTWYSQKETPGLGAEIATPAWQKQFVGKSIFKDGALGIVVAKGIAHADNAVDGLPGATLTGEGVTRAYQASLAPYRALLDKMREGGL